MRKHKSSRGCRTRCWKKSDDTDKKIKEKEKVCGKRDERRKPNGGEQRCSRRYVDSK